ncbi:hypothetical protein RYX36_013205 [Vicia faba]
MANEFSHVNPIQFFKIICDQNLHQQKLMMPTKFVEKYGENLPEDIYLETPNGEKWNLNLVKSEGKIWFDKGWNEFVEYHSLSHGHLLVFKYEQISHFKVHIFDKTTLEINYPFKKVDAQSVPNDEDLENIESRKTGKELVIAEKPTALERAISFKACNPSFHIIMRPSYIDSASKLYIPKEFGRKYLIDLDANNGDIHLRLLDGRVWPAKYLTRKVFINKERFEVISKGWRTFTKDNNLKVGDVCTFELFPTSTPLTFLVHIFRDSFET